MQADGNTNDGVFKRIVEVEFDAIRKLSPEVIEHDFGWAAIDPGIPLIWSANFLAICDPSADAERVIELGDEILGSRGLEHRQVHIAHTDARAGEELVAGLKALDARWEPSAEVYMPHLGESDRRRAIEGHEVTGDQILVGREELATEAAGAHHTTESMRQLLRSEDAMQEGLAGLWFAAGEPPDGFCQLLLHPGGIGQVENVGTMARSRGRGLASAAIIAAIAASKQRGDELLYVCADAVDWPQHLYEKLGFVASGRLSSATLKPPPARAVSD